MAQIVSPVAVDIKDFATQQSLEMAPVNACLDGLESIAKIAVRKTTTKTTFAC
jgi:hypothetical protein